MIVKAVYVCALICVLMIGSPTSAQAVVIFQDNFNIEHGGTGSLNYAGFANWTVNNGTVDLIGNGYYDFYPGNGLYVDLDGSSLDAGLMQSNIIFSPGTYLLSFYLGGSRRGDTNTVTVNLGTYSEDFILYSSDPFALVTRTITTATGGVLSFFNAGDDNKGAILDNVSVSTETSAVPEPGTCLLLGIGLLGLIGYNWRRFKQTA